MSHTHEQPHSKSDPRPRSSPHVSKPLDRAARPVTTAARGEELAAEYLEAHGLRVLARNWHSRYGELDIVAREGPHLIAVEVKTRTGTGFGDPLTALTARKVARVRRLLYEWARTHRVYSPRLRIDAVGILLSPGRIPRIDHLRGIW